MTQAQDEVDRLEKLLKAAKKRLDVESYSDNMQLILNQIGKHYDYTVLDDNDDYPMYQVEFDIGSDNSGIKSSFDTLRAKGLTVGNVGIRDDKIILHFFTDRSF